MKNLFRSGQRSVTLGIILMMVMAFLYSSCEKDHDIPLGTFSVLIDGKERSFNTEAKAEHLPVEGGYGIKIHGYKGEAGATNELSVIIASGKAISLKTYIQGAGGDAVKIQYMVYMLFWYDEYSSLKATITISEINSTRVRGTFSGTLVYQGSTSQKVLSEGVFHVSF